MTGTRGSKVRFHHTVAHAQALKRRPNRVVEADFHEVGSHTGRVHSSV